MYTYPILHTFLFGTSPFDNCASEPQSLEPTLDLRVFWAPITGIGRDNVHGDGVHLPSESAIVSPV